MMKGESMRKLTFCVCLTFALTMQLAPAEAIIGGAPDGSAHSSVAAVQAADGSGVVFTGVAISETAILTVAHGAVRIVQATGSFQARATFDTVADGSATWYMGSIHIDPAYNPAVPGDGDYAIIEFASPLPVNPARLPTLNGLSSRSLSSVTLPVVGYGTTALIPGTPYPDFSSGGLRKVDLTSFQAMKPQLLKLRMPDGDQVCVGDSGGPSFLGDTDVVAGITLGALGGCISSGTVTQMRVDTSVARAFIGRFVSLP
jgi:hypothetical protein